MQHHKYSLTEIESMFPFERDIYVAMLADFIKTLELKQAQQEQQAG